MHARALDFHKERVDTGPTPSQWPASAICKCGCGEQFIPKWNKTLRSWTVFIHGHNGRIKGKRTVDEWAARLAVVNDHRPMCECGCGQLVKALPLKRYMATRGGCHFARHVRGHERRAHTVFALTDNERSAILGTLLGDASIVYPDQGSVSPRVYGNHSIKQAEWVRHKANFLSRLGTKVTFSDNPGFGSELCSWKTSCQPCLSEIHSSVVINGRKTVTAEWLDLLGQIGLAWWICDDGSACDHGLLLHTEGYSLEENNIVAEWFSDSWHEKASVYRSRKYHLIRLSLPLTRRITSYVWDHVPKQMRYKLDGSNGNLRQWRVPCV